MTYPTSGAYAWTYTIAGTTASPSYGLAFGHASTPSTSYTVEPASSALSDVFEIDRGSVNATTGVVSAIAPSQLLYIANGVLKQVPLNANGAAPVGVASPNEQSNFFCKFLTSSVDYATPSNSNVVVSTAGPDKVCGTADDGAVVFAFNSSGGLVQSSGTNAAGDVLTPIAPLRDPASYAPIGWFDSQGINTGNHEYILYPLQSTVRLVQGTPFAVLATANNVLTVVSYTGTATAPTSTTVPSVAACAWNGIGFDGANFYTYCNSTTDGTYTILKVPYSGASATVMLTGSGAIELATLGLNTVYATIDSNSTLSLQAINKATLAIDVLVSSTTIVPTVLTTNTGNDFLWQVSVNGSTYATSITVLNAALQPTITYPAGFPSAYVAPTTVNLNQSENRSQFLLLSGYTQSGAASGADLINYNTGNAVATTVGTIPSASTFGGTAVVFTSGGGGGGDFLTGFAEGISGTTFETGDSKAFSFTPDSASSLTATTPQS